ncbi:NYN domain-containing protein [Candidatus Sumerlaeota bacterium]|nr:NYN domain-containing protein [Candidatus Sumerlaeota bacterium]
MRIRRIAVLIDGGFFIKRLPKLVPPHYCDSAASVAQSARTLCKRHVQKLIGERFNVRESRWLDHVYRLFYYDASPFDEVAHNPILNQQIQFGKTDEAKFRRELFDEIRRSRKFALRLGHVVKEDGWRLKDAQITKKLLRTRDWLSVLESAIEHSRSGRVPAAPSPAQAEQLEKTIEVWRLLTSDDIRLGLRQKGVDMRIGLDISTLTLKKQVDTIILVTGDSDFVPAAKLARREGVEFLLDPLWQSIKADLHEHVDGVVSCLPKPSIPGAPATAGQDEEESQSE